MTMNKMIFILAVASILFPTVFINAQECSEKEMMEMMRAGYSESEIYNICGYTLGVVKCCCETKRYIETAFFGSGSMEYDDTSFEWRDTYDCETSTYYFLFVEKREAVRQCVADYFCR